MTEEEKKPLFVQILDALNASKEKTHVTESSENLVDKNEGGENGISGNLADEAKEEQNDKESSERLEKSLLKTMRRKKETIQPLSLNRFPKS